MNVNNNYCLDFLLGQWSHICLLIIGMYTVVMYVK